MRSGEKRRKSPRALVLTLPESKKPVLWVGGKKVAVRNFSEEGLGVTWTSTAVNPLSLAKSHAAQLQLGDRRFDVALEVMHVAGQTMGLRLLSPSETLKAELRHLLAPTVTASNLCLQPSGYQEETQSGFSRLCLKGENGSELLLWYQPPQNGIVSIQLCFSGYWVSREQFRPVQTGMLQADTVLTGSRIGRESLLLVDDKPKASVLAYAAQLLGSVPFPLPGYLLWQFLETGEQVYLPTSINSSDQVA